MGRWAVSQKRIMIRYYIQCCRYDTWRTFMRLSLYKDLSLQKTQQAQESEVSDTTGVYISYSFRTVVWVLLRLTLLNYLKTLFSVGLARVWTWDLLLSRPVLISNWANQVFWEFQLQKNCHQSCSSKFMTMHLLLGRKAWLVALFWMCFLFQVLMGRSGLDPGKHPLWHLEREFLFHR